MRLRTQSIGVQAEQFQDTGGVRAPFGTLLGLVCYCARPDYHCHDPLYCRVQPNDEEPHTHCLNATFAHLHTQPGITPIQPGDWVVELPGGIQVIRDRDFWQIFDPVEASA